MSTWLRCVLLASLANLMAYPLIARGDFLNVRKLPYKEKKTAIEALFASSATPLSTDPGCKDNPNSPGVMTVAEGFAKLMTMAAETPKAVIVDVDCFTRNDYPISEGQEYCRFALLPDRKPGRSGIGLLFIMDWKAKAVVPNSVECYD